MGGHHPESVWHLAAKAVLADWARRQPDVINVAVERFTPDRVRRSDVRIRFRDGRQVAMEVQATPLTDHEWSARHTDYQRQGITDVWLWRPGIRHPKSLPSVERHRYPHGVQLARDVGALDQLPISLQAQAVVITWCGDFPAADALITEARLVCEATGTRMAPVAAMHLAALRGRESEAAPLIEATFAAATAGGQGTAVTFTRWMTAVLCNGLARYADAEAATRQASRDMPEIIVSTWALPELVEAAACTGNTELAASAAGQLAEATQPAGTDWALGIEARCRALVSQGQSAEDLYREAIDRLGRTRLRPELARAHLLYGEWLRRENRRTDARQQLRVAHDLLSDIGMEAFAERARRELAATGETARKRTAQPAVAASQELTAQEAQVALLARDGLSNPEIGARLFISSHTVQYHLGKVFTKLGITSRGQLHQVLHS